MASRKFNSAWLIIGALIFIDAIIWFTVSSGLPSDNLELYFLDVGQGDSQLIVLPDAVQILIDGGQSNGRAVSELAKILPASDTYLDIVAMTHPQADHFGGLIDVVKKYEIGVFISSGREADSEAFKDLKNILAERRIPTIILGAGDSIVYGDSKISVLYPESSKVAAAKDVNDTSLVMLLEHDEMRALYTGDITSKTENLLAKIPAIKADILKVPHHGSKFSSSAAFLSAVNPKVSIIGVGKNNYGHPTPEALGRLAKVGAAVFMTNDSGTIKIVPQDGNLQVFSSK